MVKARQEPPPEPLEVVRGQIQYWRQSRKVPGPMPGLEFHMDSLASTRFPPRIAS